MRELSLYTGAGGGLLATQHLLTWETIGYVEKNRYCQKVLRQRIADGILDAAPIYGDVENFIDEGYADAYQGLVDIVTAGFPCQPFSVAGKRRRGSDSRNLWPATLECIRRIRPRFAFLENVPGLTTAERFILLVVEKVRQLGFLNEKAQVSITRRIHRLFIKARGHSYFGRILGDLAEIGYDARWRMLSAAEVGAPHRRNRLWIVAHANYTGNRTSQYDNNQDRSKKGEREKQQPQLESGRYAQTMANSSSERLQRKKRKRISEKERDPYTSRCDWWNTEHELDRLADGMADRMERLKALGNGEVPLVAACAWEMMMGRMNGKNDG